MDVCAIVTFLLDAWAGICNFLKATSLMKLSELQESIKAVMLTLSFILTEIKTCLRSEGHAAVIVESEDL